MLKVEYCPECQDACGDCAILMNLEEGNKMAKIELRCQWCGEFEESDCDCMRQLIDADAKFLHDYMSAESLEIDRICEDASDMEDVDLDWDEHVVVVLRKLNKY